MKFYGLVQEQLCNKPVIIPRIIGKSDLNFCRSISYRLLVSVSNWCANVQLRKSDDKSVDQVSYILNQINYTAK